MATLSQNHRGLLGILALRCIETQCANSCTMFDIDGSDVAQPGAFGDIRWIWSCAIANPAAHDGTVPATGDVAATSAA